MVLCLDHSIVLIKTVPLIWQIIKEGHFVHENKWGARCHMCNCNNQKVEGTQACAEHQPQWDKHVQNHSHQSYHGSKRRLQRPEERLLWQPAVQVNAQPHDEPTPKTETKNYFSPPHFYCVETICAPCGTVIAWAKFAKSESPTKIGRASCRERV